MYSCSGISQSLQGLQKAIYSVSQLVECFGLSAAGYLIRSLMAADYLRASTDRRTKQGSSTNGALHHFLLDANNQFTVIGPFSWLRVGGRGVALDRTCQPMDF